MTLPNERYKAIKQVRTFLRRMLSAWQEDGIKKIPRDVRTECFGLLKHYPTDLDLERIAECPRCSKILSKK